MCMRILMLFFDGLGLGEKGDHNPLYKRKTPFLKQLLGGRSLIQETAPYHGELSSLLSLDTSLNWPGLPQSATGQTALFSGVNPLPLVKQHLRGLPSPPLRKILKERGIFTQVKKRGLTGTFANAYRPSFFNRLEEGDHSNFSATTTMVHGAGLPFRSLQDLKAGKALYQDITHAFLQKMGFYDLPLISYYEAGKRLALLSQEYDFTLFESFLTDQIGHARDEELALELVRGLDLFLKGILTHMDLRKSLVLFTSDHGNFEDLTLKTHTHHPVPVLLVGHGQEKIVEDLKDLTSIVPALMDLYTLF